MTFWLPSQCRTDQRVSVVGPSRWLSRQWLLTCPTTSNRTALEGSYFHARHSDSVLQRAPRRTKVSNYPGRNLDGVHLSLEVQCGGTLRSRKRRKPRNRSRKIL